MKSKFHEDFYSFAKYYDIAFDFKDIPKECSFLKELAIKHLNHPLTSFIEFGAGPALHREAQHSGRKGSIGLTKSGKARL